MVGFEVAEADYKNIDPKHLCARCKLIARRALQSACGHRYCFSCVDPELSKGSIKCYACQAVITKDEVFPDKFADREILQLVLLCINHARGCAWKGELRHREDHQTSCDFTPVTCVHQDCGKEVTRAGLADHLQYECLYREELCSYCEQPIVVTHMKDHYENQCQRYAVMCPAKCGKQILCSEVKKHLDPSSANPCDKLDTGCPFNKAGCPETKVMNFKERKIHLEQSIVQHASLLLAMLLDLSRYLEETLPRLMNQPNGTVSKLQRICDQAISGIDSLVREFGILNGKHKDHETRIKKLEDLSKNASGNLHSELQSLTLTGNFDSSPMQEILRRVNNAEAKSADHEVLVVEVHTTIEELRRDLERSNTKLQEAEEHIRRLERRLESQDQAVGLRNLAIADLEEKINDLEGVSFDGVLMWKIENIAQKRNDARTGRLVSFYSQCFNTGPHGYKMCARIYLNGDGMGKGTHISLFFVLMRGNYDALLRWPFRQKVTLMLLDQDNEEHIIDAFRPDPGSSSFQKPRTEMNIASGCPLLCSHTDLQRHAYIRDDAMFIKIIVDKPDWN